jgi:hypothetical protein
VIALALSTNIPMSEWEEAGSQAIATALELLAEVEEKAKRDAERRS